MYTVFYLNPGATPEVRAIIAENLPPEWTLLTPASGSGFEPELARCDFILVADHPVSAQHVAAAPRLKMIQHQGVGYERIDLDACRARGIPVALTPEGTSIGVAEHTILLILALYKQLVTAATGVRAGRWLQWALRDRSFELCGKTLGLIGFGRIGREVAKRARAFDARVMYFDPEVSEPGPASDLASDPAAGLAAGSAPGLAAGPASDAASSLASGPAPGLASDRASRLASALAGLDVTAASSLHDLLAVADIVSLHVPLNAGTRHLIDRETLGRMKPGAVLINTSRGGLVDESALLDALQRGHLAGAALDVLEREPPPPDHPLLHLDQVLITPHIAAGTRDALHTKMRAAFANLMRFTRGEPLRHVVAESVAEPLAESITGSVTESSATPAPASLSSSSASSSTSGSSAS